MGYIGRCVASLKTVFVSIMNILYQRIEHGTIYKIYDVDHCLIRYNMMKYRKEKIKEIYMPKFVDKSVIDKIMDDLRANLKDREFNIKRIHRNEAYICMKMVNL